VSSESNISKRKLCSLDEISKFNSIISTQWINLIISLLPVVNTIHGKPEKAHVESFCRLVLNLVINKGKSTAITMLKSYRVAIQQYVLFQHVGELPFHKVDRDGIPICIKWVKPDRTQRESVMYSLSILRIIESFTCEPSYDVSTITDPSTADPMLITEICNYIDSSPKILKVLPKELKGPEIVLSNKAGPNGPASISALDDLVALQQELPSVLNLIEERLTRYGSDILPSDYLESLETKVGEKVYLHSKTVFLSDKACKTRVIAIADWWSNMALSNLHAGFMLGLKRLMSDATYHQDKLGDLVKNLGSSLYSSDMTAFTDRFPLQVERKVVEAAYGTQEAHEWETIITGRNFYHWKTGPVAYKVGNPMGILSSWSVSSFTHHVVKSWCAAQVGIEYSKYLILGDDTIDTDRRVYDIYTDTIRKLGVSINGAKCTVSEQGYAEFAKRLFTPEGEVTGLPVHLLEGLDRKPEQFIELLRLCRLRGYKDENLCPAFLALLADRNDGQLIACILSLPEALLGFKPLFTSKQLKEYKFRYAPSKRGNIIRELCSSTLLETSNDSLTQLDELCSNRSEDDLRAILLWARDYSFWKMANALIKESKAKKAAGVEICNNHPLWGTLYNKAESFMTDEAWEDHTSDGEVVYLDKPDPYYIHKQWLSGNYREMAVIPSISPYKYYSKAHYETKCKFDVLTVVVKLLRGNCNIPLYKPIKLSDKSLFKLALYRILPNKDSLNQTEVIGEVVPE